MYDHILRRGRKHFCEMFTEGVLKGHIKDRF